MSSAWKTSLSQVASTFLKETSSKVFLTYGIQVLLDVYCRCSYHTTLFLVTAPSEEGMLEGRLRGQCGRFPSHCVQEVRLRNPEVMKFVSPQSGASQMMQGSPQQTPPPPQQQLLSQPLLQTQQPSRVAGRREMSTISNKDKV